MNEAVSPFSVGLTPRGRKPSPDTERPVAAPQALLMIQTRIDDAVRNDHAATRRSICSSRQSLLVTLPESITAAPPAQCPLPRKFSKKPRTSSMTVSKRRVLYPVDDVHRVAVHLPSTDGRLSLARRLAVEAPSDVGTHARDEGQASSTWLRRSIQSI